MGKGVDRCRPAAAATLCHPLVTCAADGTGKPGSFNAACVSAVMHHGKFIFLLCCTDRVCLWVQHMPACLQMGRQH